MNLSADMHTLASLASIWEKGSSEDFCETYFTFDHIPTANEVAVLVGMRTLFEALCSELFQESDLSYLHSLTDCKSQQIFSDRFIFYLSTLKFRATVEAVSGGIPVAKNTPFLKVTGRKWECLLMKHAVENIIKIQTAFVSEMQQYTFMASPSKVVDFGVCGEGLSQEESARLAVVGGCVSSSYLAAGVKYHLPIWGYVDGILESQTFPILLDRFDEATFQTYLDQTSRFEGKPIVAMKKARDALFETIGSLKKYFQEMKQATPTLLGIGKFTIEEIKLAKRLGLSCDIWGLQGYMETNSDAYSIRSYEYAHERDIRLTRCIKRGLYVSDHISEGALEPRGHDGEYYEIFKTFLHAGEVVCDVASTIEVQKRILREMRKLSLSSQRSEERRTYPVYGEEVFVMPSRALL